MASSSLKRSKSLRRKVSRSPLARLRRGWGRLQRAITAPPPPSAGETARKIRRLEIQTERLVRSILGGQYQSVFKGRGMMFDEVREYQEGDDPRTIDWNVTARMDRLFVKKYVEERELTVILAVDASASLDFATTGADLKRDLAARFAMTIALSAMANHDRVGLFVFGAGPARFVPPRRSRSHVLRLVRDLLTPHRAAHGARERTHTTPSPRFDAGDQAPLREAKNVPGADFAAAMRTLARLLHKPATIFLCSDFLSADLDALRRLARHDVVAVTLIDPTEERLPELGRVAFMDPETGDSAVIDTSDPVVQTHYSKVAETRRRKRQQTLRALGIDEVELRTGEPFTRPLFAFFRRRGERRLNRRGKGALR